MFHSDCPLEMLTAMDLMSPRLVTVPENASLAMAAKLLAEAEVHGAPVVDFEGVCVGVISTTDFMRVARAESDDGSPLCEGDFFSPWQLFDWEHLPAKTVSSVMSPSPFTVPGNMKVGDVARRMLNLRVHRLIVVDAFGDPLGVISATDLLQLVAAMEPEPQLAMAAE